MGEETLEAGECGKGRFLGKQEVHGKRPFRIKRIFINRKKCHGKVRGGGIGLPRGCDKGHRGGTFRGERESPCKEAFTAWGGMCAGGLPKGGRRPGHGGEGRNPSKGGGKSLWRVDRKSVV